MGVDGERPMICVHHRDLIRNPESQMIECAVVQRLAVGNEQHEIQMKVRTDQGCIAMGPFLGPSREQSGIEPHVFGQVAHPDAAVEFLGGWACGKVQ